MAGSGNIWKKRLLIPLWVVQLIATVIFLGLSALALWYWNRVSGTVESEYPDLVDGEDLDDFDDAIDAGAAVNFAFAIFTIIMVFVEMILFCTHRLGPVLNIVFQSIKSAIWTFYIIITIIAAAQGASSGGIVFLVLVIFVTSICQLIYGATLVHRKRKGTLYRGNYTPAQQTAPSAYDSYTPKRPSQSTGYAGAPAPGPSPFRDPSPAPPYNPPAKPAHGGEAGEYYNSYEMQNNARR